MRALRYVSIAGRYDACILTRGGGSQEDLWVFNREEIARAIADCPVPVISAVGHEIDFTVADLAADLRAPTPSAAAELVAPDSGEIARQLNGVSLRMETALHRLYTRKKEALYQLQLRHRACSPAQLLGERGEGLAALRHRLQAACAKRLDKLEADWHSAADLCESLNPAKVLSRGYAIAQKGGAEMCIRDRCWIGARNFSQKWTKQNSSSSWGPSGCCSSFSAVWGATASPKRSPPSVQAPLRPLSARRRTYRRPRKT